ncbi:Hint domain-containing protein [Planktotalea sp.]|uniref:Hint domain-containing protein n=1 Tax=Planktotalea sp. TaxID=2029877 RepID=UPI003D6AB12A
MPVYYRYVDTILGSQSTVNGSTFNYATLPAAGSSWSWTGSTTSFLVEEASPLATNFNGDEVNEVISPDERIGSIDEQIANIGGIDRQLLYDFTFSVTAGDGTVYSVAVIDVDLNNDNDVTDPNEDGYFLVFPDGVPPAGLSYTFNGLTDNTPVRPHLLLGAQIVCFTKGTEIATRDGMVKVEDLEVDAQVLTRDRGYQQLRWIGKKKVPAVGDIAPVFIPAGVIGNERDISVSPQHRMLIKDPMCEILFGETEVLVPAIHLLSIPGVRLWRSGLVEYYHLLFDQHEIVYSNECWSESFHPGDTALRSLSPAARHEVLSLFPELEDIESTTHRYLARRSLRRNEAKLLFLEIQRAPLLDAV